MLASMLEVPNDKWVENKKNLVLDNTGTDGVGVLYRNSWRMVAPYEGIYTLKGTAEDAGKVIIDGTSNIAAEMSIDATGVLSKNIVSFLTHVFSEGKIDLEDENIAGLNTTAK